jgi:hypothetical protein
MLGSIVGPAVVGETEAVGVEVVAVGAAVDEDGSGLAPPPQAESKIEAARMATGVFFTVPPTDPELLLAGVVSTSDQPGAQICENNELRTPHTPSW